MFPISHFTDTGKLNKTLVVKIILDSKMMAVPRKSHSREMEFFNKETEPEY
jgi:hypothetical protein